MCILDDVCATMHAQGEGADAKLLQVRIEYHLKLFHRLILSILQDLVSKRIWVSYKVKPVATVNSRS